MKSDLAEIFWSVLPYLVVLLLAALVMIHSPSLDAVVWGR